MEILAGILAGAVTYLLIDKFKIDKKKAIEISDDEKRKQEKVENNLNKMMNYNMEMAYKHEVRK